MKFFQRSTTDSSSGRSGQSGRGEDWSRTPAAIFASVVLGMAALGGLGWSWNRAVEQDSAISAAGDPGAVHQMGRERVASAGSAMRVVKLIDLNSASAAELDLLPRIGPALAARIIADREENGLYEKIDDLERVSGIGPKTVEKLRSRVILGESDQQASASTGEGG